MSGISGITSNNSLNSSYLGSSNLSTNSTSSEVGDKRIRDGDYSGEQQQLKRSKQENDYDVSLEDISPFEADPLTKIPQHVSLLVFDLLSKSDLGSCAQVSKDGKVLAEKDTLWKKFLPEGVEDKENIKTYIKSKNPFYGAQYCESYKVAIQQFENFVKDLPINTKGKYQLIIPGSNQKIECELKVSQGLLAAVRDSKIVTSCYNLYEKYAMGSSRGYHQRGPDYKPFEPVEYSRKYKLDSPDDKDQLLVITNAERTLSKGRVELSYKLDCSLPESITKEYIERFHIAIDTKLNGDPLDIENDWELIENK